MKKRGMDKTAKKSESVSSDSNGVRNRLVAIRSPELTSNESSQNINTWADPIEAHHFLIDTDNSDHKSERKVFCNYQTTSITYHNFQGKPPNWRP